MNFEELNVISPLLKAILREGFDTPTKIQEEVIPFAIKGKDILGSAQTGSGKTLAFALPILQNLYNKRLEKGLKDGKIKRKIQALVIAPTRELAIQIGEAFAPYSTNTNMKHTVIYGGVNQFHQVKAIEKGVDILIATPGRLEDLISQGIIKLSYVEILTLDEADRMLDLGFLADIKKIIKRIPKQRQTFFFSATMPKTIKALASSILHCPEEITVNTVSKPTNTIKQQVYHIKSSHRRQLLQQIVKNKKYDSILVFVKTMNDTEYVLEYVKVAGIKADSIHKKKTQNARQKALKSLKNGEIKVLVATDIASRGLDINDLSCVINFHIPSDSETYVHRIGRTARAGKKGVAISFCIDKDKENLSRIESLIGKKIEIIDDKSYLEEVIPKGRILGYKDFEEDGKKKYKSKSRKKRFYGKK
ncbi:MAG: DEAD/DEAH box helicase [Candidatus Gracilibacteria bacterium]